MNLKRCTKCGQEFPRTAEFFSLDRRNTDRLAATCRPCDRERNRIYMRERRKQNPDLAAKYYAKNRDKELDRLKRWGDANPGRTKERIKRWATENPDRRSANEQRRRARKLSLSDDFTPQDWRFALDYFKGCCAVCGRPPGLFHALAMDHWIPLYSPQCKGTIPTNIVPLCDGSGGCNQSKNRRNPEKWLTDTFGKKQSKVILAKIQEFFSQVRQV